VYRDIKSSESQDSGVSPTKVWCYQDIYKCEMTAREFCYVLVDTYIDLFVLLFIVILIHTLYKYGTKYSNSIKRCFIYTLIEAAINRIGS